MQELKKVRKSDVHLMESDSRSYSLKSRKLKERTVVLHIIDLYEVRI